MAAASPWPGRHRTLAEYERQRQDEAKEKTRERIAAFRMSSGMDPFL
jgi:hypothetical protein